MTQEYLELMKADLMVQYKDKLCEESIESIQAASTPEEFIGLLAKFSAFLNYKCIPEVWWVRKWFNNPTRKRLAETNGVYFEGYHSVVNPQNHIVVMGNAKVVVACTIPHLYRIMLQEQAECDLSTYSTCIVNVRKKDDSQLNIVHKHEKSKIKIRTI